MRREFLSPTLPLERTIKSWSTPPSSMRREFLSPTLPLERSDLDPLLRLPWDGNSFLRLCHSNDQISIYSSVFHETGIPSSDSATQTIKSWSTPSSSMRREFLSPTLPLERSNLNLLLRLPWDGNPILQLCHSNDQILIYLLFGFLFLPFSNS